MSDRLAHALAPDVRLAAAGDLDAFARLVNRTSTTVCSITLAIVRNVEDSEDIAQEVYLAAWQSLPKLRNPASFLPWLRQTARNRARHGARTHARAVRHRLTDAESAHLALNSAVDPRPAAHHLLISQEDRAALDEAMSLLPEEAREIVALYYREGQSVRTVADLLELSEDAVKKRLQRARETLRAHLLGQTASALQHTTPGAALTTAVLAALAIGAPTTAAAASLTLGSAAAGTGWSLAKFLPLGVGAFLGGLIPGVVAFLWAARRDETRIIYEEDRRRMRRLGIVGAITTALGAVSLFVGYHHWHTPTFLVLWYLAFASSLIWIVSIWRSRIMTATWAAERAADPTAASRQRREHCFSYLGAAFGLACGAIPIILAILYR